MTDLVVIVPTRGRPDTVRDLTEAFAATCTADTQLVFAVDCDDPLLADYDREFGTLSAVDPVTLVVGSAPTTTVGSLNAAAWAWANLATDPPFALASMGDGYRPRTPGWDRAYVDALHDLGTGIVYGGDPLHSGVLLTQCAMTADIVRALGYMAPPRLRSTYVDHFWLELGREANCLHHLPEVVFDVTPGDGVIGEPDDRPHDRIVFWGWQRWIKPQDVARVRQLAVANSSGVAACR